MSRGRGRMLIVQKRADPSLMPEAVVASRSNRVRGEGGVKWSTHSSRSQSLTPELHTACYAMFWFCMPHHTVHAALYSTV